MQCPCYPVSPRCSGTLTWPTWLCCAHGRCTVITCCRCCCWCCSRRQMLLLLQCHWLLYSLEQVHHVLLLVQLSNLKGSLVVCVLGLLVSVAVAHKHTKTNNAMQHKHTLVSAREHSTSQPATQLSHTTNTPTHWRRRHQQSPPAPAFQPCLAPHLSSSSLTLSAWPYPAA